MHLRARVEAARSELDTALSQQKRESGQALQGLRDQLAAVTAKAARLQVRAVMESNRLSCEVLCCLGSKRFV